MIFETVYPTPKEVEINGVKVQIKQYLPMADKNSILEMTIQTADGGTVVNTLALDAIFELYLIFKYTDIEFTDEEKEDLFALYDKLECAGIIEDVIKEIPSSEYKLLHDNLLDMVNEYKAYRNSAKGFIDTLMLFAPTAAEKFNDTVSNLDTNKIQNIVELVQGTGFRK